MWYLLLYNIKECIFNNSVYFTRMAILIYVRLFFCDIDFRKKKVWWNLTTHNKENDQDIQTFHRFESFTFQNNYSTKISSSIKLFMIRLVKHHPSWNLDTYLHFLGLSKTKNPVLQSSVFKITNSSCYRYKWFDKRTYYN